MRTLYIVGEISAENYLKFSEQLAVLEGVKRAADNPITIELFSEGGDAYSALAFAGRIRNCKSPTIIIAHGYVASAAVLILASGVYRKMSKEAWVMVHEDSGEIAGNVTEMQRDANHFRRLENQWAKLLEQVTNRSAKFWADAHTKTTYFCARECLDLGIIDEVI
jgi:ATP-dependent protease ClpP protease subunit